MAKRAAKTPRVTANAGPIMTADSLRNAMTGLGGDQDKLTGTSFMFIEMPQGQLDAAYRGDWITRKGVDIPAFDATREWRSWQAETSDITKIEALEKKFKIQHKVMRTLQRARLYGGAALVLGVDDGQDPSKEMIVEKLRPDSLKFVHSVSRYELGSGPLIQDVLSPYYGKPEYFTRSGVGISSVRIHPSRVITFVGAPALDTQARVDCWGDSVLQAVHEAVIGTGLVTNSVAQLVAEQKLDIIKVPGLSKNIATKEYEDDLKARFAFSMVAKSVYRTLVMDKEEDWERIESNFGTLPDIQKLFLLIASGAFDIPATRFLGQSPAGLSSTGDSDIRNYYDRCTTLQKIEIQPELKTLDDVIIRSSLGISTEDSDKIFYNWNPLWQLTETEKVAIWKSKADTFQIDFNAGLINEVVLKKGREAQLIEDGVYPGLEALIEEYDDDPELEAQQQQEEERAKAALEAQNNPALLPPPDNKTPGDTPPSPGTAPPARPPQNPRSGATNSDAIRVMARRVRDASSTPRSLYVRRDVLNARAIKAWAKEQGFASSLDDMHVTVIYSRTPVDWLKIGSDDWSSDDKGNLTVKAGGPRVIERFGEGAVVLAFSNSSLQYRNMMARDNGASWDYEDYTPHITITYLPPPDLDLGKVTPYAGVIELGPEIFEEVKSGGFDPSEASES